MQTTLASNPLLSLATDPPFDRIEPSHVEPAVAAALADAREKLAAVKSLAGPRTYANTLAAFDDSTLLLDYAMGLAGHLESVATTPALREAYNAVQPVVSAFYAQIPLDEGLYAAVRAYAETADARALTGARKRHLAKTLEYFERYGARLSPEGKTELERITVALSVATTKFSQNTLDATNAWDLVVTDEARLAGLPAAARSAARDSARARGVDGWRFTLQGPSYLAVMTHLEDRTIREAIWRAYNTRASSGAFDNRALIEEILALRAQQAKLLGFGDFADFVLADRMARDGARARAFVDDLRARTEPFWLRENEELHAFRKSLEGESAPPLAPWDVAFYAEKLRLAKYDFDEEALRPYLEADRVLRGMFETVERIYGVKVTARANVPVWHASVRAYAIEDHGGHPLATFYTDLYPRESKRDGAWMKDVLTRLPGEGPHVGLFCANQTPPGEGRPALLTHREVETLFHEFGHLLHHALSTCEVRSLAGTRVAWDFVELPSQIMENWCWERDALDLFARHHETGARLPDELFDRMRKARTFRAANAMMRQLSFATVDLALHCAYDPARDGDPVSYARGVMQRFYPVALPDEFAMLCSFGHLFASPSGYAAAYYSYKWAEVLDADAFTRFKREGIFSREAGAAFRAQILANGDGEDPAALFRTFMGRDATVDALMERSGLVVDTLAGEAA